VADDDQRADRVLDALVANTEAMTHLNATVQNHQQDFSEGRKASREFANNVGAKLDNLDRSIGEMKLASENAEKARQLELKRIYDLLGEERKDRREAVVEGREGERDALTNERDHVRQMVREELGDVRDQRDKKQGLVVSAGKEIWKVGGKYIVAAVSLLIVAAVMKMTGLSLADIIGLTSGK